MAVAQRLPVSMSCEAGAPRGTPSAVLLLLGFLLGVASAYPLPSRRTNATLLERRWETLFSRSVLGVSGEKPEPSWESDYLLGIKRVRRLYCNVGIGFHLQVLPDGTINGAHNENQYSEFSTSAVGREHDGPALRTQPATPHPTPPPPTHLHARLSSRSQGELDFFY